MFIPNEENYKNKREENIENPIWRFRHDFYLIANFIDESKYTRQMHKGHLKIKK